MIHSSQNQPVFYGDSLESAGEESRGRSQALLEEKSCPFCSERPPFCSWWSLCSADPSGGFWEVCVYKEHNKPGSFMRKRYGWRIKKYEQMFS